MSFDAWSSEGRALPRAEELPVAEQGYDRDAVQRAFDAFYRHIAQLDSTLKTLEAVDAFQRQAGELRTELRALRASGWTQQPWTSSYSAMPAERGLRPMVSPALPRIAAEVAFIIAVAVVAGVGHFSATLIIVMLAGAWAIVGIVEWFAARERIPPPVEAPAPAVIEGTIEPSPAPAPPEPEPEPPAHYGWSAFSEEGAGADAMTMAGGTLQEELDAAAEEPEQLPPEEPEPRAGVELEPVVAEPNGDEPRRRWFRRRREADNEQQEAHSPAPSNVRVLTADEAFGDEAELEPDVSTDENAVGPLRRFRRR